MFSKLRLSVLLNIVLLVGLLGFVLFSQQVSAGETSTDIDNVTVSLVVPDDYESCAPSDIIETTNVPDDWTVDGFYGFVDPNTGQPIFSNVQASGNGNFYLVVTYPPVEDWPATADGGHAIIVSTGVKISSPSGERAVLSMKWTVTCKPDVPTETPVPPTKTPVPPTETPVPPTKTPTPPTGGQGCTPGYWKQSHHFDSWVNYVPADDYETVFGVDASFDKDLEGALKQGGGGEKALGRHATAALLNSVNPNVSYLYSEADVISMVQAAYASGDFEGVKNLFEAENEMGCPLN